MKYYVETTAYDFDLFLPSKKEQPKIRNINNHKNKTGKNNKRRVGSRAFLGKYAFFLIFSSLILISGFATMLLKAEINETSVEISRIEKQITEKESEAKAIEAQIENLYSYKNIDEKAKEIGMGKPSKYQVNYIKVKHENEENTLEIRDNAKN